MKAGDLGIPADAKPWEIVRAVLPPGWRLTLVGVEKPDAHFELWSLLICPEKIQGGDSYFLSFATPVMMTEDEASSVQPWVEGRKAGTPALTKQDREAFEQIAQNWFHEQDVDNPGCESGCVSFLPETTVLADRAYRWALDLAGCPHGSMLLLKQAAEQREQDQ